MWGQKPGQCPSGDRTEPDLGGHRGSPGWAAWPGSWRSPRDGGCGERQGRAQEAPLGLPVTSGPSSGLWPQGSRCWEHRIWVGQAWHRPAWPRAGQFPLGLGGRLQWPLHWFTGPRAGKAGLPPGPLRVLLSLRRANPWWGRRKQQPAGGSSGRCLSPLQVPGCGRSAGRFPAACKPGWGGGGQGEERLVGGASSRPHSQEGTLVGRSVILEGTGEGTREPSVAIS